jgi:phospholipid/cholesterol/gamma-HCH transport system substrate-binding protein
VHEDVLALRAGAGIIAGLIAATAFVLFGRVDLAPTIGIEVRLGHLGGLAEGAPVQSAGRIIGHVDAISLDRASSDALVRVRIERDYAARAVVNGTYFVNAKGVLGERYLEVGPPDGGAPRDRPVRDGDQVRGVDPPQLDRLAAVGLSNITAMRALARELLPEARALARALDATARTLAAAEPYPGAWQRSWRAQRALYAELGAWRATAAAAPLELAELARLARRSAAVLDAAGLAVDGLRQRVERLDTELERVRTRLPPARLARFERALDQLRTLLNRTEAVRHDAVGMIAWVDSGRGSLGGFLTDRELRDIGKTLGKILKRRGWEVLGRPPGR